MCSWPSRVWTELPEVSTFQDVYEPFNKGIWNYKPCSSIKRSHSAPPYAYNGVCMCPGPWDGATVTLDGPYSGYLLPPEDLTSQITSVSAASWNSLGRRWEAKLPAIDAGVPDFAASLAELRDITSLLEKRVIRFSIPSVCDFIAKTYVEWSFAVRPLISDILSVLHELVTWKRRITKLINQAGKVKTAHVSFRQDDSSTETLSRLSAGWCCYGTDTYCRRNGYISDVHMTGHVLGVTGKYRYRIPSYLEHANSCIDQVYAFRKMFNLILADPETMWELTPFSFVVDWFFNTWRIFKWLKSVDPDEVRTEVTELCVTQKSFAKHIRVFYFPCFGGNHVSVNQVEKFDRWVGANALSERLPWFQWPSSMQLTLGAALSWLLLRSR